MYNDVLEDEEKNIELPWILFEVSKNSYAVNSADVISIIKMTDDIISVPDIQDYIRGIMDLRGSIIPLIDLRIVFGEKSYSKLIEDYKSIIEEQKQSYEKWIVNLLSCINKLEKFELNTDVDKSDFGKWCSTYDTTNASLKLQLSKLLEPHERIYKLASQYNEMLSDGEIQENKQLAEEMYNDIKTEFYKKLVAALEDSIEVLRQSYKEMIIVLEHNNFKAGIIVDKVKAIENVVDAYEQGVMDDKYYTTKYIVGVGKSDKSNTTVLKLNIDNVLSKAAHVNLEAASSQAN